jgi:hypothetical protein
MNGNQDGSRGIRPGGRGLLKAGLAAAVVAGAGGWRSAPAHRAHPARLGHPGRLRKPGSLPYPDLPAGTGTIPEIERIVVLVMENHSYDNKLGMLRRRGADGFRLGPDGLPPPTRTPTATSSTHSRCRRPARTTRPARAG